VARSGGNPRLSAAASGSDVVTASNHQSLLGAGSLRRVGSSSLVFALASGFLVVPGVVRTKMAAVEFGPEGVGLFGQLSLIQTVLIVMASGGVATAGRVALSRTGHSPGELARLRSWLLIVPAAAGLVFAMGVVFARTPISEVTTGSSNHADAVVLAALGLPFAIMAQVAVAVVQASGARMSLLVAAVASMITSSAVTVAIMSLGDPTIGAWSFLTAPAVQAFVFVVVFREARGAFSVLPRIGRENLREIGAIAWASVALGAAASGVELALRSNVVNHDGLASLGAYQPTALLATQLLGLGLSALATSALLEFGRITEPSHAGAFMAALLRRIIPVVALGASAILGFSPFLIRVFFTSELVKPAIPILAIALAAEAVRVVNWILGSIYLPWRMRGQWLAIGLTTVVLQLAVGLALIPLLGVYALPLGVLSANLVVAVLNPRVLARRGVHIPWAAWAIGPFAAALLDGSFVIAPDPVGMILIGPLAVSCFGILASVAWFGVRRVRN